MPRLPLLTVALLSCVVFAAAAAEPAGAVSLFNGRNLDGWGKKTDGWVAAGAVSLDPNDAKKFVIAEGTGVLVNGPSGKGANLISEKEWGDVEAHIEFCVPKGSNSGVYFQGRYEIQVLDSFGVDKPKDSDNGGIYHRWKDNMGYDGHAPRVNASKAPGQWQAFDVVFRAPRFDAAGKKTENGRFIRVVHNGQVIHENAEVTGPTRAAAFNDEKPAGPLMIQGDHGPVAFRNLRVKPVKL